jgi:hypothetical protein
MGIFRPSKADTGGNRTGRHSETPQQTLERARLAIQNYQFGAGKDALISVAHVLDLLDPLGVWRYAAKAGPPADGSARPITLPEGMDPITGCMPPGPNMG